MTSTLKTFAATLAGGVIVAFLCVPVNAEGIGLGVGASVGGTGGVNAGLGASIGGSKGIDAGLGASVGGSRGVNAGAGASVGGGDGIDAGATASIGGKSGLNAGLGAAVGGGIGAGAGASLSGSGGTGAGVGVGIGTTPGSLTVSNPGQISAPGLSVSAAKTSRAIANMSDGQLMRMKRRCSDVLGSSGGYDADLRQLCTLLASVKR